MRKREETGEGVLDKKGKERSGRLVINIQNLDKRYTISGNIGDITLPPRKKREIIKCYADLVLQLKSGIE